MSLKQLGVSRQIPTNVILYQIICPHCGKETLLEIAVPGVTIQARLALRNKEPVGRPQLDNSLQVRKLP